MTKPVVISVANQKGGVGKSIFRHEPNGKAAQAYRTLVKEVLEIGEKQRGKPFDLSR